MSEFKPYMTTRNTYQDIEKSLHDGLIKSGLATELAKAVAHNLTLYQLGYVTAEGVAQSLLDAGADEETARGMALLIVDPDMGDDRKVVNG